MKRRNEMDYFRTSWTERFGTTIGKILGVILVTAAVCFSTLVLVALFKLLIMFIWGL